MEIFLLSPTKEEEKKVKILRDQKDGKKLLPSINLLKVSGVT